MSGKKRTEDIQMDVSESNFIKNRANHSPDRQGFEIAFEQLDQILSQLSADHSSNSDGTLFVSTSLEFAKICFVLGKGFNRLIIYLKSALTASERIGDRRSWAIINLHLGRLFYFAEQRDKAISAFSLGQAEVDALGDEDITAQAAEYIGLYYFIQGHFPKAVLYFEQATKSFEFGEYGHSGPMWLSYCYSFLGQHHRAIGTLDYYRRLAHERGDHSLATTLRAVLGIILVGIKKSKDATYHLLGALREAIQSKNNLAVYFARGGLTFHHMMEGQLRESREWLSTNFLDGARSGLIRQYASPMMLETLFEYHRHNITPIPGFTFQGEIKRILQDPNIHLRGVALRLLASEALQREDGLESILLKLQESEDYLKLSGDPIQLGRTRIEMARLRLKQGDMDLARPLAQKAWKDFSGYGDIFYPDDLRDLLVITDDLRPEDEMRKELLQRFTDMIQELVSSDDLNALLAQTVQATNRFLGAERGGIFWFSDTSKKPPKLIAAHNLFESDVSSETFRSNLALIFKAFHEKKPYLKHNKLDGIKPGSVKAMLAVPFEVKGRVKGVLYHDNSYINDCFSYFSKDELTQISKALSKYIVHVQKLTRRFEEKAAKDLGQVGIPMERQIIARSKKMTKMLSQADKIAVTTSTVLVTGETGVGKELLARRIHDQSLRNKHALVIVDPTSIPETLVESELFGHEKGAFTGADRQKLGRIEIANKGTLFIDEVGEIPMSVQAKLLRALQERTMVRVGGITPIHSDFRLIAATNRNLLEEVKRGRFREDLYYRLNVIPIELPPLRDRGQDIITLAEYFLNKYGLKYNRSELKLSQANEDTLMNYDWPGNVRELQNIMERAVLLSENSKLDLSLRKEKETFYSEDVFKDMPTLDDVQRRYINLVLEQTKGKIGGPDGAAKKLGMKRTSLYPRMKKLGIR